MEDRGSGVFISRTLDDIVLRLENRAFGNYSADAGKRIYRAFSADYSSGIEHRAAADLNEVAEHRADLFALCGIDLALILRLYDYKCLIRLYVTRY